MDILKSIEHRMSLVNNTYKDLKNDDRESQWETDKLDQKISSELSLLKNETKKILEECTLIHKAVFQLGSQLREKVPKQELKNFDESLKEWPLEEFISHKELTPFFERYAKR